jgi:hypothetical protein
MIHSSHNLPWDRDVVWPPGPTLFCTEVNLQVTYGLPFHVTPTIHASEEAAVYAILSIFSVWSITLKNPI